MSIAYTARAAASIGGYISVFFFSVLDLTAENNPPRPGREKDLGSFTLRACLAGASAPTRPDIPSDLDLCAQNARSITAGEFEARFFDPSKIPDDDLVALYMNIMLDARAVLGSDTLTRRGRAAYERAYRDAASFLGVDQSIDEPPAKRKKKSSGSMYDEIRDGP